jgi:hypothetical protein
MLSAKEELSIYLLHFRKEGAINIHLQDDKIESLVFSNITRKLWIKGGWDGVHR